MTAADALFRIDPELPRRTGLVPRPPVIEKIRTAPGSAGPGTTAGCGVAGGKLHRGNDDRADRPDSD